MLSYQHGYHAGNFADVVKHVTLVQILQYLTQKDKPLFYLETHAGRGMYDLHHPQALKTGEFKEGIQRLWDNRRQLPALFKPYLQCIKLLNPNAKLRYYPGSPWLAQQLLRTQDRLFLAELHPQEFSELTTLPHPGKRVHFSHCDGLEALSAQLPPSEKRGLIFIDPAYEVKQEYRQLPELLAKAYRRFTTGVYCVWYPILDQQLHRQLVQGLQNMRINNTLQVEFNVTLAPSQRMKGCGLWVINPPYILAEQLKQLLDGLTNTIYPGSATYRLAT